ncbi:MAG: hypothetical protein HY935_08430 [Nitrosomonadales bacterium]|nr:hypothetical protein [Nitrosomonadales bacterium]
MGTFNMDMSSYEIERGDQMASGYSDEVLCAGWIPNLVSNQPRPEEAAMPVYLAEVNVEVFLRKMYACQR